MTHAPRLGKARFSGLRIARFFCTLTTFSLLASGAFAHRAAHAATSSGLSISGTPATEVQVNHQYYFKAVGYSASGRALTYSIRNHPGWSTFNKTTGVLSGVPYGNGTYYDVRIRVTDGITTTSLPLFNIKVTNSAPPRPPTISGTPPSSVAAGQTYSFTPTASDPSGKALSFSVQNKPSWASFSISTGRLSGTPPSSTLGTNGNIAISVSDGTMNAALPAFSIKVTSSTTTTSQAPTISGTPPTSVTAGQSYSFKPTASDPSGKALTFSISNKPSWASFSASTGQLSGTPGSSYVGTYSNIVISVSDGTLSASLAPFSIAVNSATQVSSNTAAPVVLYTDVSSGPNSGGENNAGAYLSIFGKNFGSSGLGSAVKVYIGGAQVASYRYLGPSRGRPDLQQLTVQVGALGNPTPGKALPIEVTVNGIASNTDQTFTVNPGRMLFVSRSGNDSTAIPGDITHPYRHVQNGSTGAFDVMRPGDTIVMRGTPLASGASLGSDPTSASAAWTDTSSGYFLRFINLNGTAPSGAADSGPLTLIAYPNEDVYIYESYASGAKGAISGVDTSSYAGGRYVTVADLRIEAGGPSGVINQQIAAQHWRIVNNELTAATGSADPYNLAGAITGNGPGSFWVGNHVHNIQSASPGEMHGIYIDGDGSYEVAYNLIESVGDGNGFQVYVDGTNGSDAANNVHFHHNLVHGAAKYALNIADGSSGGFLLYDNIVYGAGYGCLRFNTNTLTGAKLYNNTFYNCVTSGNSSYGVVTNDGSLPSNALDMENNILYASAAYTGGMSGMSSALGTFRNNLFYNGTDPIDWDAHPITGNPQFLSTSTPDFHLASGSPAIGAGSTTVSSAVTTDYDVKLRSSSSIDIGAYQY